MIETLARKPNGLHSLNLKTIFIFRVRNGYIIGN